ncbi:MAG: 1-acyl-sn-glycerol-3-phosphate acyltransferase [Polynucleobacter sp.]|nr:MAG: 1-acyl-sn-glycerol-3-phosphate acyltransferase [Polynucleobacter sp.]
MLKTILLILHVLSALLQLLFFIFLSQQKRMYLVQRWARILLAILRVRVHVQGDLQMLDSDQGYLMVANHISWLDIHVINSLKSMTFVAKSDVAQWPIFGWIAKQIGTIFIKRSQLSDLKRVIQMIQSKIKQHQAICIFPEGTSSDGRQVLEFRSNLFEVVAQTPHQIIPLAIQYQEGGRYSDRAAFIGDMGLIDSIKRIMQSNSLVAYVYLAPPINADKSRQELALQSREAIVASKLFDR